MEPTIARIRLPTIGSGPTPPTRPARKNSSDHIRREFVIEPLLRTATWTSSKKDSHWIGLFDRYCCCEQRTHLCQMPPLRPDAWQTPNDQSSQDLLGTPHDRRARQSDSTLVPSGHGSPLRARLLDAFAGTRELHIFPTCKRPPTS